MKNGVERYAELDAAIVAKIKGGATRFVEIWPSMSSLAMPLYSGPRSSVERIVDRRLQALTRQRKIRFWRGNWEAR